MQIPGTISAPCQHPDKTGVRTIGDLASFAIAGEADLKVCDGYRAAAVQMIQVQNAAAAALAKALAPPRPWWRGLVMVLVDRRGKFRAPLAVLAAIGASLAGCVSAPMNAQSPTATEQLLTRHAARRAAAEVNLVCRPPAADHCVAPGAKVWGRVLAGDETPAGKAAVAEVLQHLSTRVAIADAAPAADVRVDLVVSAVAIDDEDRVIGVPPISIPACPAGPRPPPRRPRSACGAPMSEPGSSSSTPPRMTPARARSLPAWGRCRPPRAWCAGRC